MADKFRQYILKRLLVKDSLWKEGDPFLEELVVLIQRVKWFLNDEKPYKLKLLAGLLRTFMKKYPQEIFTQNHIKSYLKGIEISLSVRSQYNIDRSSWLWEKIHEDLTTIPHMLHDESFKYYKWLGRVSMGFGDIVEVGCWMGAITVLLAEGLSRNVRTMDKIIHAIDSFNWNNEMYLYCEDERLRITEYKSGYDFLDNFIQYTHNYSKYIVAHKHTFDCSKLLSQASANSSLIGSDRPIEYLVQDISPNYELNKYIWDLFSPFFVDKRTIIVYGHYGNIFANDVRQFVLDHSNHLVAIHKPRGNVKAFLYHR